MTLKQVETGLTFVGPALGAALAVWGMDGWHINAFGWVLIGLIAAFFAAVCVVELTKRRAR